MENSKYKNKNSTRIKRLIFLSLLFLFTIPLSFSQDWQIYDSLRAVYQEKQIYDTAIVYAEKTLQAIEGKFGKKNAQYALSLINLAYIYYTTGNYQAAEPFFLEGRNIDKEVLGEYHPYYVTDLDWLTIL